jgi:hypothetical protein
MIDVEAILQRFWAIAPFLNERGRRVLAASEARSGRLQMAQQWQYQVRIYLADQYADLARRAPESPAIKPLADVLAKHQATMSCQFDAFAGYVAEAEQRGADNYPLYEWTKATIEDAAKKERYLKSFTVYVDGNEVYGKESADALEADLRPLVGGELITRMTKHDTNPANNPQPPSSIRK